MSPGPVVHVTRDKQPEFITVTSVRLQDGSTKFEIVLEPDGFYRPADAYVLISDGERNRFTAKLALEQESGKEKWRIVAGGDDDVVRDGRILITYGLTTGEPVSKNWSIAFAEFAPNR